MFTLKSPAKVTWEITTACTRTCHFCYNCSGEDNADPLTREQREIILVQIIESEPLHVVVTGGEPLLLADELASITQQLQSENIYTQLWTNGDLIAGCAQAWLENCDLITLPLFGKNTASHDRMMGAGSFNAIMDALTSLSGMNVEIAWILTKDNYCELDDAVATLNSYPSVRYVTLYPYTQTGRGSNSDHRISGAALEETMTNVITLNREYAGKFHVSMSEDSGEIRNLVQGRQFNYQVYVTANGEVLVHQYLPFTGGNVLSKSLESIWQGTLAAFWSHETVKRKFKGYRNLDDLPRATELLPVQQWLSS